MIHFDEMACLLYLEGQLDDARSRELIAHTGECAACRTLLHALEHETHFLASALTEENESMPARLLSARGWTVPSWVWTLAFGVFAAGAYWLWTDSISPWIDQLSNAGFGGTDLMSMVLFTGAFWEGWGDMVNTIQIAALIVVALGAVGLIRRRLRRSAPRAVVTIAVVISALLFALALPQPAAAADVRRGRAVSIPASETIHNDLIVAGPSVRVDGTVEGDLIVFTRDLTLTGHVTGDVIAFARQVIIDGKVDGNVRTFSQNATLQGSVGKNVSAFASSIDLAPKGNVGGGMIAITGEADLDGRIQRDLLGVIGRSDVDGPVGGELWIRGGTLAVASTAEIGGPARFEGREQPAVAAGAKFASPLQVEITQEVRRSRFSVMRLMLHEIFSYGAAVLVGILLITVFPGFFHATLREVRSIGLPIGIGALALVIGFFLLILGILLLFVGVGAGIASLLAYAPIVYVAQVFVGAWLGIKILGEPSSNTNTMIGRIAFGLLILHVAGLIPFLGVLVWLAVGLWGTGAVLMGAYRMSRVESVAVPA
jgi:cytoskeletal protein CcmA (bactofilin family)